MTARVWDADSGKALATLQGHTDCGQLRRVQPRRQAGRHRLSDSTARVWDAGSGKALASLQGHTAAVRSAAFSPDGKRVVTASCDRTARVWDADSGKALASLQGHTARVLSAAFSPDGKRVVTASGDNTARVWDAGSGKALATLQGHTAQVHSAAFSPDGKRVVTASDDRTARVWDADSGKALASLQGHTAPVVSAAFSPDGKRVVTASCDNDGAGLAAGSDRGRCRNLAALGRGLHRNRIASGWCGPGPGGRGMENPMQAAQDGDRARSQGPALEMARRTPRPAMIATGKGPQGSRRSIPCLRVVPSSTLLPRGPVLSSRPAMNPWSRRLCSQDAGLGLEHLGPSVVDFPLRGGVPGEVKEHGVMAQLGGSQPVIEPGELAIGADPRQDVEPLARPGLDEGRDQKPIEQLLVAGPFPHQAAKRAGVRVAVRPLEPSPALASSRTTALRCAASSLAIAASVCTQSGGHPGSGHRFSSSSALDAAFFSRYA